MLRLITGLPGTGKTDHILTELRERVLARQPGAILIVPEQYSHEAERDLCRVCGDSAALYAEVLSFSRLAGRGELAAGKPTGRLLDAGGRLLCMTLALDTVGSRLQVFGDARRRASLQKRLLDTVDMLKSACITPEALEQASGRCHPALGEKLRDLALILAAYNAVVANGWADPTDRLQRLAEQITDGRFLPEGPVYVDGFTDFTRQELEVLHAMLRRGVELCLCLTCDTDPESEVYAVTQTTLRLLQRMAQQAGVQTELSYRESAVRHRPAALEFLSRNLFTYTAAHCPDPERAVTLLRADSLAGECELCAAQVLELVQRTGCRWRDVVVAVRGFEDYRPALENAFALYGIPLYTARRSALRRKNPCALIDLAYAILEGGWDGADVTAYLRTGLLGLTEEETDTLENYIFLWRLRGHAWTGETPWSLHPAGQGKEYTPETEQQLQQLQQLRQQVAAPLLQLARRSQGETTALEQVQALADFLEELQLSQRLAERAALLEARGETLLAAEYSQVWDILVDCLEQCADILGETPLNRTQFIRLWQVALAQYAIGTIPVALDRVTAGDMDRVRRRRVRHLFVLGCTDSRLPRVEENSGLFSDEEREQLLALELYLGSGGEDLFRELNLISQCLSLPSESLHLLYSPGTEGEDAGFVLGSIARMLQKSILRPSLEAGRLLAPEPAMLLAAKEAAGRGSPAAKAASRWLEQAGKGAALRRLQSAACMGRGELSPAAVRQLYGSRIRLTASRADRLAGCKFSYFMQYGLKAKPRKPADFAAPELGNFMHYVLERVARQAREMGGFSALRREDTDALTARFVRQFVQEELNDFRERSPRFVYLFRRLTRMVQQVVNDMAEELRHSAFAPLDFELRFDTQNGDLPAVDIGDEVFMVGAVDRVDGWLHEGRLYLRVVDYKTGQRSFSLSDVCQGVGLQMLLYLFALEELGPRRYGHPVAPAGALYIPARDITLQTDRRLQPKTVEAERQKALRRSGLLLEDKAVLTAMEQSDAPAFIPIKYNKAGDPSGDALATAEQFGALGRHIRRCLADMAAQLRSGAIQADPYYRSATENVCVFCDYCEACHFDEETDRRRYQITYKKDAAWDIIRGKEETH